MTVAFYLNSISPHQLPLATEVARIVGFDNFIYLYADTLRAERKNMGWGEKFEGVRVERLSDLNRSWLESADLVYTGLRCFDLMAARIRAGRRTVYYSERWLKPHYWARLKLCIPGILRIVYPRFAAMTRRFLRLVHQSNGLLEYWPSGIWAARDMARLDGLVRGDLRCLFRAPTLSFDPRPMGAIANYLWMKMWGYFVAPSNLPPPPPQTSTSTHAVRVLWVGRMIGWKRVDTIIKAIKSLPQDNFSLTLVGNGDKRESLVRLAAGASNIMFKDSIPIVKIRDEMRAHDVYVLSSNGEEGWGAALNEALEEKMCVLGTFEAGASATILSDSSLFHAGNWHELARLLGSLARGSSSEIGLWSVNNAARVLVK